MFCVQQIGFAHIRNPVLLELNMLDWQGVFRQPSVVIMIMFIIHRQFFNVLMLKLVECVLDVGPVNKI